MPHTRILEDLLVANHRLTRLAAQSTGSSVASAVWSTLSVLRSDGPHRIGDLARAARITQPGMTKVVQGLVESEWATRIADVEDSRAWLVAISPRGEQALAGWRTELSEALEPIFAGLTDDQWSTLARASEILATRVATRAAAA